MPQQPVAEHVRVAAKDVSFLTANERHSAPLWPFLWHRPEMHDSLTRCRNRSTEFCRPDVLQRLRVSFPACWTKLAVSASGPITSHITFAATCTWQANRCLLITYVHLAAMLLGLQSYRLYVGIGNNKVVLAGVRTAHPSIVPTCSSQPRFQPSAVVVSAVICHFRRICLRTRTRLLCALFTVEICQRLLAVSYLGWTWLDSLTVLSQRVRHSELKIKT